MTHLPSIGLGTFGSDKYSPSQVAEAVLGAAEVGYRHFDCAAVYGNEKEVGQALRDTGLSREQFWVTSKLWNDRHGDAIAACEESLRDLKLDYLDLYLIHWPYPNYHPPGCDVDARSADARPFILDEYMKTWRQLEELVQRGLVRRIGTSNMTISKLRGLLSHAEIRPFANQMEQHPHFQQPELFDYLVSEKIQPVGYCPLGSPSRPERDRTPEDTADMEDPVILALAEEHGVSPATICLRWAIQRGSVPIPFSVKREQYEASLKAVTGPILSEEAMQKIAGIDRNCRLIKGQVFLWPGAGGWEDLWE